MLNEKKIDTEKLRIKFLSPLVVRSRENEKDYYYSYDSSEFEETLKINIKENYIEFDTVNLKNFHKYYFNYFFDKYNLGKKTSERIEESFGKINKLITTNTEEKDDTRIIQ